MRTGRLPISGPCGCNLCLVIGRLAAFCHSGDLGPAPVAFATDRLRVLYNELLDIWARGPALGPLVQPPPVAAGGGPGASTEPTAPPPKGGSPPDTPVPEGAKVEVQPEERDRTISPATTRATPAVAPEKNPFSSPPPAPGAGDPDQSFDFGLSERFCQQSSRSTTGGGASSCKSSTSETTFSPRILEPHTSRNNSHLKGEHSQDRG